MNCWARMRFSFATCERRVASKSPCLNFGVAVTNYHGLGRRVFGVLFEVSGSDHSRITHRVTAIFALTWLRDAYLHLKGRIAGPTQNSPTLFTRALLPTP